MEKNCQYPTIKASLHQAKKMTLPMTPHTIISDVQNKFQAEYAYLNLRFFRLLRREDGTPTVKKFCDPSDNLGMYFNLKKKGDINIADSMTVDELIAEFYNTFGIHVQVFRKSANLWMEITLTNNWTLLQQNNHGKEISVK